MDGKDIQERSVGWLHSNIGYVLQTPNYSAVQLGIISAMDGRRLPMKRLKR